MVYSASMALYVSKYDLLPGSSHAEVIHAARYEYHKIEKRTPRRQTHVKSRYFKKEKVFINQFWVHMNQKHPRDRLRRAKLFLCAIDLIRNTASNPDTIHGRENKSVELHRFYGRTKSGLKFGVQIRENKRNKRKDFMSVFPISRGR